MSVSYCTTSSKKIVSRWCGPAYIKPLILSQRQSKKVLPYVMLNRQWSTQSGISVKKYASHRSLMQICCKREYDTAELTHFYLRCQNSMILQKDFHQALLIWVMGIYCCANETGTHYSLQSEMLQKPYKISWGMVAYFLTSNVGHGYFYQMDR